MKKLIALALMAAVAAAPVRAAQPVDPDLIPEARKVLDYLESVYGKKMISGMSSYGGWRPVYETTGRIPAIYSCDASGWNKPKHGDSYNKVVQDAVNTIRDWWLVRGGIPAMQWHWMKPGNPEGSAWVADNKGTGPADVGAMVTPGTEEYKAAMEDMKHTADFLEQLAKARVPVLWRPLHEIDGGWFWWTDKETPENTAKLWRMMFDYFVKERKLHNLIWVYSAGVHAGGLKAAVQQGDPKKEITPADEIAFRKRYYPGPEYVDLSGIDIYPDSKYQNPETDTYPSAYELMKEVTPGKILALTESQAIPNPGMVASAGPQWLYALPWFTLGKNPAKWMRESNIHPHVVTLEDLPALAPRNIAPDVRIESPRDGAEPAAIVSITGHASDRNGNLKSVEAWLVPGWKNWFMRGDDEINKVLEGATRLGEAQAGPEGAFALEWKNPPAGLNSLVLVARDAEGATAISNFARVALGKNLAQGGAATASSDAANAPLAVDGDTFTSWAGRPGGDKPPAAKGGKKKAEPMKPGPVEQWLAVDLGAPKKIGGVAVTWWKAYARDFRIEVSSDGAQWREAARKDAKKDFNGDTDLLKFAPVEARHVRLVCLKPGTNWGGYNVFELGVYESLP